MASKMQKALALTRRYIIIKLYRDSPRWPKGFRVD